jgi:uncharacterized protein YbjT (DUF2867 family)
MTPTLETGRSVAVAGATGLVGRAVVRHLLADPSVARVVALVRRPVSQPAHPKFEAAVVDFDRLPEHDALLAVDQVVCALGTTIKQAGSRERFRQVDFGYPFELARIGVRQGARHFLLVSALGADRGSTFFYNRVKGELEAALRALPYRSLTVLRPSLLLGNREEFRLGEEVASRLGFLAPPKYKPVEAEAVAKALAKAARADLPGVRVIESKAIRELAA